MLLRSYKHLIYSRRSLLGFGFLMAFYSSVGQTFFVGVFGPQIQAEFNLSHTAWGTIYMLGTLASALVMPWSGNLIDRYRLITYSFAVCALLTIACGFMAFATGPAALVFGIFLLRHAGQGLADHTATTSMARYFDRNRGQAIAISSLGTTTGQSVLPYLAVAAISVVGWRLTYGGAGVLIAISSFPIVWRILRGHDRRHREHMKKIAFASPSKTPSVPSWTRQQVLRDPRFYLLLPGMLAPAMIGTAFFFHHLNIAEAKHWDASWASASYVIFGAANVISILTAGSLVDRFGASKVVKFILAPLVLAAIAIGLADHILWLVPYMLLLGLHSGFSFTSSSALWPELYGVANIGSIKSLYTALKVLSSALGPILMGMLLDLGVTIQNVCFLFALYAGAGSIMIVLALRLRGEQHIFPTPNQTNLASARRKHE